MDDLRKNDNTRKEPSREDLLRLLSSFEGELQARDIVIAALKSERTKQILCEVKYGHLVANDPFKALQRDSNFDEENEFDENAVGKMYESQISLLERLISVQRRSHQRSQQILAASERRHLRILRELDEEKKRSVADAAQGDDICALLENDRARLRQQLEYEQRENDKLHKEIEKLEKRLLDEKERHKSIVLFLINERKQLLLNMYELKMRNDSSAVAYIQQEPLIAEMRKEIISLRSERDHLKKSFESAKTNVTSLKEVIKSQEGDLTLMRNSMLANSRFTNNATHSLKYPNNLQVTGDGSLIVVNKAISASLPSRKSNSNSVSGLPSPSPDGRLTLQGRLSGSSSFPNGGRTHPSRVPLPSSNPRPATSPLSTMPPIPNKFNIARKRSNNSNAQVRSTNFLGSHNGPGLTPERCKVLAINENNHKNILCTEPEIEQLGAIIDSMTTTKLNKRSASLPRNGKNKEAMTHMQSKASPSNTSKRSGFFKALGVSARSDRSDV
ncbi:unnamed protein product [Dracunculus medinensis]|uniref:CortBP2 domain-containing protein n=1 Tax=Dracunculus medinensis TaxID=318479 RepID=A0A158Q302_DRAME|nr:unnamed protein product [Dracunculus medinensis]